MNLDKQYHVCETGDYSLIGPMIDRWDSLGYSPILMSQVVKRTNYNANQIVTTLVFEKREIADPLAWMLRESDDQDAESAVQ